jgi:hypothetical protein
MRRGPFLVALTAAIAFVAGCSSSASPGTTSSSQATTTTSKGVHSSSGKAILAAAVAATKRQSSFHFVERAGQGASTVLVVGDVGTASGKQEVTIRNGKKSGHLTLLLASGTAYFKGDLLGLQSFTGLSAKLSAKYAGKWISVPSTSQSFNTVAGTLAVSTAASQLVALPGTLTRGRTATEFGQPAVAVDAAQKSSSGSLKLTMYIATTGEALPILVFGTTTVKGSAARSVSARFTKWGETFHVSVPKGAVPISVIQALTG